MNMQRKLAMVVATGALALGAGHVVQTRADSRMVAAQSAPILVSSVTPLAATDPVVQTPELSGPQIVAQPSAASVLKDSSVPEVIVPAKVATPALPVDCPLQLDAIPQSGGLIGLTMLAPCHIGERVVLRHAGLAVTTRISESGTLFASLPAMSAAALVEVRFASGEQAAVTVSVPEAEQLRRFAVQWQDADAFQLHAFEGGASYGAPGHYSAAFTGTIGQGASVMLLGDSSTDLPLLAEVFTFAPGRDAEIVLEAAVTEATCGRELFAETLMAEGGRVDVADLTLAMPGCEAVGDIIVLKNLAQDMKLAAAQ